MTHRQIIILLPFMQDEPHNRKQQNEYSRDNSKSRNDHCSLVAWNSNSLLIGSGVEDPRDGVFVLEPGTRRVEVWIIGSVVRGFFVVGFVFLVTSLECMVCAAVWSLQCVVCSVARWVVSLCDVVCLVGPGVDEIDKVLLAALTAF